MTSGTMPTGTTGTGPAGTGTMRTGATSTGTEPAGRPPVAVAPVLMTLGVLVLAVTLGLTVLRWATAAPISTSTATVAVGGVTALDVVSAADTVAVRFADQPRATLHVTGPGGAARWTFRSTGTVLQVFSPSGDAGFAWWAQPATKAVLVLPMSLQRADARFSSSAGALSIDGAFGDLTVEGSAGSLEVRGSAETLHADLSAGSADLALSGVTDATFDVSAGTLRGTLEGAAPDTVALDVSAGELTLTLPDDEYTVDDRSDAGSVTDGLRQSADARHTVSVDVSAGSATLRPAS